MEEYADELGVKISEQLKFNSTSNCNQYSNRRIYLFSKKIINANY